MLVTLALRPPSHQELEDAVEEHRGQDVLASSAILSGVVPILPRHVTGVSRNRVVLATYGKMGSQPWEITDNPGEE